MADLYFKNKFSNDNVGYKNKGIKRDIRLREGRPFADLYIIPNDDIIGRSDNLEQKPYIHRYDENGFLLPNNGYENPDAEIYFLGGSTTMCSFNEETARFPYLCGKLLSEKTGKKINTYNAAHSNNNSLHSINILLNKIIPQKPDKVVMMHNCNDFCTLSTYENYWNNNSRDLAPLFETPAPRKPFLSMLVSLKDWLFPSLYTAVEKAVSGKKTTASGISKKKKAYMGDGYYVDLFSKNLELFIAMCRAENIEPVLMTQAHRLLEKPEPAVQKYYGFMAGPYEHQVPLSYAQFRNLELIFNETIRKVGAAEKVMVIDLEKNIPAQKEYMYDPYHLTDKGCEMAAAIISDSLAAPMLADMRGISAN